MAATVRSADNHVLPNIALSSLEEADTKLRNDPFELSFQDRTSIDEEIHGVHSAALEETSELLESSIIRFAQELRMIPNKTAYDKSQRLFPNDTYVNTIDFRMRFLRCELFDAKKAAIRMVNFLDCGRII